MPSRPWTPVEEEYLARRFVEDNKPYSIIAGELSRPVEEVRRKGQKMGLWGEVRSHLVLGALMGSPVLVRCSDCGTFNDRFAARCAVCRRGLAQSRLGGAK